MKTTERCLFACTGDDIINMPKQKINVLQAVTLNKEHLYRDKRAVYY